MCSYQKNSNTIMPDEPRNPLISVVIVNFNGRNFLKNCLSALHSQTYSPLEVILVDNASTDGSIGFVQEQFPWVALCPQQENLGFAGGSNAGIREAGGEFILTLNPDTIPSPDFIEQLARPMSADPMTGMCASKMLLPDGRINSTGICISRSGAAWDRGMNMPDQGQFDEGGEVFGPCGGAALYRRAMLDETGDFDEDFFLYMEDVDLAFRGRLSGWKCSYVPGARVMHIHYVAAADATVQKISTVCPRRPPASAGLKVTLPTPFPTAFVVKLALGQDQRIRQ